ncbi:hypothetical protein KQI30_07250 [Clostridium bornimense]|uniref:hypothetical protein n=1 Tax=Clostridium bornimense TaxID=1216932 RepID=UPI001C122091|nr:hypothetical protein [Clostridium bornimense]MBU5316064.1 hypothetical protein [Clostridium bornimense]
MNKVIGYKLNRDESRKKVEKFYQDYIKNKWIEIFVELDKEYQKNLNVIINDVVRDFSKVCQRVIELQKRNEKGKVKYIYFSFLRTNILADNGDFRVDIYDENWFLDNKQCSGSIDMSFVFKYLFNFIEEIKKNSLENKISMSDIELEKIKLEESERYKILAIEYLKTIVLKMVEDEKYKQMIKDENIYIIAGEYMDECQLIYPKNIEAVE